MKNHPLETLSEYYLKEKHFSKSTLKSYRIAYKKYIEYLKKHEITYAKTSHVIHYRELKREMGYSTYYLYIHISALKGLYNFLKQNQKRLGLDQIYQYNIMETIKNEKIKARIKKPVLTPKQVKNLILSTKVNRQYLWEYRNHAIIYLMIVGGLSVRDIVHAKREDYLLVGGQALLYLGGCQDNKARDFVKIPFGLKTALEDYLLRRKDSNPYLFISHRKISKEGHLSRTFFRDMFAGVLKVSGLDGLGITPHCLRHTTAILNLRRGASIAETKALMRHKNIQSTIIYQEYLARIDDDSEVQIENYIFQEHTKKKPL